MTTSAVRLESAGHALRAILLRECRAAIVNRYFQVFSALALAGGMGAVAASESADAAASLVFQFALYFVSLFATLAVRPLGHIADVRRQQRTRRG